MNIVTTMLVFRSLQLDDMRPLRGRPRRGERGEGRAIHPTTFALPLDANKPTALTTLTGSYVRT